MNLKYTLAALMLTALAAPLAAVYSNGPTPANGQPSQWTAELQSTDNGQLPAARDKTAFIDGQQVWAHADMFRDLHIEGNYIFVSGNAGFEIWDKSANPGSPTRLSSIRSVNFPISSGYGHGGFICTREVATPPGNTNVAVVVMDRASGGVVILNTTNKSNPHVIYQDSRPLTGNGGKTATAVYCATINGVDYAFAAVESASNGTAGINIYNLNIAMGLGGTVVEAGPGGSGVNIFNGMKPASGWVPTTIHGAGNFVVTGGIGGWEIFNVANPSSPMLLGGDTSATGTEATMWQDGGSYYVAVLRGPRGGSNPSSAAREMHIYDVTDITTGNSTAPGTPLAIISLSPYSANAATEGRITFSRTGSGTPMLCFNGDAKSTLQSGQQTFDKLGSVLDVTNPANPREVTPVTPGSMTWWGWIHQYGWVRNQTAYFDGNHLYRASMGVFDIYEWNPSQANHAPVIASTPPTTAAVGQPYSYQIVATDPDADPITYLPSQVPSGMTVGSTSGLVQWTPGSGDIGNHTIKIEVTDGHTSVIHEWTLTVTTGGGGGPNGAPTVTSTPPGSATAGTLYSYTVMATDPEGDPLTYVKAFGPPSMAVGVTNGSVAWTPSGTDVGSHSVVINVSDGVNVVQHAWTINVAPSGGTGGNPGGSGGAGGIGGSGSGGGGGCAAGAGSGLGLVALLLLAGAVGVTRRRMRA